ncbi:FAD linked oxidase domain-containing protein [Salinisphaera sp. PC39]|uniref:FAD-binding oxidoreductase n=1 Tax=Salinisphaera sp. PC39 TaxID=1304156 RepID=UPI0033428F9A
MSATLESDSLSRRLVGLVGADNVITDEARRTYYSRDLSYLPHATAELVVRPESVEALQGVVREATAAGYAVIPRGGGMSYTQAYSPENERTVLIDMQGLDRIVEINAEDMYVVVECGCTWKKLVERLKAEGVRTPYYGPLSGMYATVGGAIAQNSLFLGSGDNHTVAESVLGLEVVLADGSLLRTGSWAHKNGKPFYRHFGPDVTGLFTADTGAFGFKARAVLRLLPVPETTLTMSFAFENLEEMLAVQIEMSRLRLSAECYGFDPYYNATFEDKGFTFKQGVSALKNIAKSGNSVLAGIANAARVARSGKRVLRGVNYSLHMTFEGQTSEIAAAKMKTAHDICVRHGGVEIDNSLPTVFNAAPFDGVGSVILGSDGEIWLPVHGFMPLSRVQEVGQAVEDFFAENKALMEAHDIRTSYLTCYSGAEFVIEPSFYWYDEVQQFRLDRIEPAFREKWQGREPQPEKRRVALELRDKLRDLFDAHGCCHLQLGRYYPYRRMMNNDALWTLIQGVKGQLDPAGLVNPGSLGLHGNGGKA